MPRSVPTRRAVIASLLATLSGCTTAFRGGDQSDQSPTVSPTQVTPETETTEDSRRPDEGSSTATPSQTPTEEMTDSPTPVSVSCWADASFRTPTETGTVPPLNATEYAAAWPFGPSSSLGETYAHPLGSSPAAVVLHDRVDVQQFQSAVKDAVGAILDHKLLRQTDFSDESIVAFQSRVTSTGGRLRLASVSGVGTDSPQLCVHDVVDNGTNATPTRLLLVRLPHRDTKPTRSIVSFLPRPDDDPTTVLAEPYR